MNDLLWVDDLEQVDLLDREKLKKTKKNFVGTYLRKELHITAPKKIKRAIPLQEIVSERSSEVGKTFFLSAYLMAPYKDTEPEPVKNREKIGKSLKCGNAVQSTEIQIMTI